MTTETLHHEHHDDASSRVLFGFWAYILTDFIMFSAAFATYIVLRNNTFGSIGVQQTATLHYVLIETIALLAANFVFGLALAGAHRGDKVRVVLYMGLSFILACVFLHLEQRQLANLLANGYSWQTSGFLSAFYTLIVMHAVHVIIALLWMVILAIQLKMQGLNTRMKTRLTCLSLFFNFITLIWIVIFTVVYLMGAI